MWLNRETTFEGDGIRAMPDGEVISVPSDDEDEAPAPKKGTLTSFWQQPDEEAGDTSTPFKRCRVREPSIHPSHNRFAYIIANRGGASSSIAFFESSLIQTQDRKSVVFV